MSGNDEREFFPPECPSCHDCGEWYFKDKEFWILPKKAVYERRLPHPVLVMSLDRHSTYFDIINNTKRIECNGCHQKYYPGGRMFERIMNSFKMNRGRKVSYGLRGEDVDWPFG